MIDITNVNETMSMVVQRATTMCAQIEQGPRVTPASVVVQGSAGMRVSLP